MLTQAKLLACLAFLSSLHSIVSATTIQNFTKTWSVEQQKQFLPGENFIAPDYSVLYAICQHNGDTEEWHANSASKINCNVTIESLLPSQPSQTNRTCNLEVSANNMNKSADIIAITKFYNVQRFVGSNDQVVFTWFEVYVNPNSRPVVTSFLSTGVFQMSDCSSSKIISHEVPNDFPLSLVPVVYQNSFDVISFDEKLCSDDLPGCRVSYDRQVRRFADPQYFSPDFTQRSDRLMPIENSKSLFICTYERSSFLFKVWLSKANGVQKVLATHQYTTDISGSPTSRRSVSNANGLFSVCLHLEDPGNYLCNQFDKKGNTRMNFTFSHTDVLLGIHNLANEKILLIFKPLVKSVSQNKEELNVWMIDKDGVLSQPLKYVFSVGEGSSGDTRLSPGVLESEDEYYLYALIFVDNFFKESNTADHVFKMWNIPKSYILHGRHNV